MIKPTAIIHDGCSISDDCYIGHYAVVGAPRRRLTKDTLANQSDREAKWWEAGEGTVIEAGAVVSSHAVINDNTTIARGAWIGSGVRVGHDTYIGEFAELYYRCQVFDRVTVGSYAVVAGFVCNDSVIGAHAQVYGSLIHRLVEAPIGGSDPRPQESEPAPKVGKGAIVGFGSIVIGGVTVGERAYVAAGSILTGDAEDGVLYIGSPARSAGLAPRPFR